MTTTLIVSIFTDRRLVLIIVPGVLKVNSAHRRLIKRNVMIIDLTCLNFLIAYERQLKRSFRKGLEGCMTVLLTKCSGFFFYSQVSFLEFLSNSDIWPISLKRPETDTDPHSALVAHRTTLRAHLGATSLFYNNLQCLMEKIFKCQLKNCVSFIQLKCYGFDHCSLVNDIQSLNTHTNSHIYVVASVSIGVARCMGAPK